MFVLNLGLSIPESWAVAAESMVALMLIVLCGMLGKRLLRERWHAHAHDHDGQTHIHFHSHAVSQCHGHPHWWSDSIKPLCIGMAHGMAGSAALLLVVLSTAHTFLQGVGYIAVFGLGSIVGMVVIGLGISLPMVWSLSFGRPVLLAIQGLACLGSIGLGLSMLVRIAMGDSLQ
jgi:hypothetical protein